MKDKINIPIPKAEDKEALNRRREDYALKRDMQASEFNEAISKRLTAELNILKKCSICGKEFSPGTDTSSSDICPDCSKKDE